MIWLLVLPAWLAIGTVVAVVWGRIVRAADPRETARRRIVHGHATGRCRR